MYLYNGEDIIIIVINDFDIARKLLFLVGIIYYIMVILLRIIGLTFNINVHSGTRLYTIFQLYE